MRDEKTMGRVIQIDEARTWDHLGEMVRGTVEEGFNTMLDPEADRLCGAARLRTSDENLFVVLLVMTPSSQELEPPANPGQLISMASPNADTSKPFRVQMTSQRVGAKPNLVACHQFH